MEIYFDEVLKQQQKVNDHLAEFNDYLEGLLGFDRNEKSKPNTKSPEENTVLKNVFGLKKPSVKPSFLFTSTPDIKQLVAFKNYYFDKAFSREIPFKASLGVEKTKNTNDDSFLSQLELMFHKNEKYSDSLIDFKTLYHIKQLIFKYARKYDLTCYDLPGPVDDFFQPNKPLPNENVKIHRIIVTSRLFSPYEFSDNSRDTALKSFQIVLHGNSKIMQKRLSSLPLHSELLSCLENSGLSYSNLRKEIHPQPPDDLPNDGPNHEVTIEQLEYLSTKYLPNVFRHRFEWGNSLLNRSELIYQLLSHFTKQPTDHGRGNEKTEWDTIICSQYPVMVKRNGKYMLVFGIRWKPFTEIKNTIKYLRQKGLYGLDFNTEHFNNFPYFLPDGRECIVTKRPVISSKTLLRNFKEQLKNQIIDRSPTNYYCLPKYPPLRYWIFDHIFNQSIISKNDFSAVMEGRQPLFKIILKYRPDLILENEINQYLTNGIMECLKFSKRENSKHSLGVDDLKTTKVPAHSKHLTLFLPFYFHAKKSEILRIDYGFSRNLEAYRRHLVDSLCDLTGCNISASDITILELLCIRDCIQEQFVNPQMDHYGPDFITFIMGKSTASIALPQRHTILDLLPNLLESVRFNLKNLRLDNLYFKLYVRGLYIPENPLLHRDFIQQKIKNFLTNFKHQEEIEPLAKHNSKLVKENLTLLSRFLNLKWKRPLSYIQVMTPSTRLVIRKLVNTYSIPFVNILQTGRVLASIKNSPSCSSPFQSDIGSLSIKALHPTLSSKDFDLMESVRNFIEKYQHNHTNGLTHRLLVLFLIECSLRNIVTSENVLIKLAILFKEKVNETTCTPILDEIESDILKLKYSQCTDQAFDEEVTKQNTTKLYPITISNNLIWRNIYVRDISLLISFVWNSLNITKLLINPINIVISKREKENNYIWNNMLEQSFDILSLEIIKQNTTSFFPIQSCEMEEREWSPYYRNLQKLGGDFLKSYPFITLNPSPSSSFCKNYTQMDDRTDIIDMLFHTIDISNTSSKFILENSMNSMELNTPNNLYNSQFGFLYESTTLSSSSEMRLPLDVWDITLKIKCIAKRVLRKLYQTTVRKEILGRIETTLNMANEISNEMSDFSSTIIDLMAIHPKKDEKLLSNLKAYVNSYDKHKFIMIQDLMKEVLEFCNQFEISRVFKEKVTLSPDLILCPREQSSHCADGINRHRINNNELYSLLPFLERGLIRSKAKEIVAYMGVHEDDLLFNHRNKQKEFPPLIHYLEKEINKISHNSFENSFTEKIIDYSYILSYGKVKLLHPNIDESTNTVFVTEAEASYMNEEQRPLFYKSSDPEWELANKEPSNHVICDSLEKLEDLAKEGIDGRLVFGGFCGGDCELLLLHPDCEELKNGLDEMGKLKKSLQKRRVEYFGEVSSGWMNFDDLVGPGIDTSSTCEGDTTRSNIWVSNEHCTFQYNPTKTLEENNKERKAKQGSKKGLKYVNHPLSFDQLESGHHHLRETIPLYDLKFLLYSAIPFNFLDFSDNK